MWQSSICQLSHWGGGGWQLVEGGKVGGGGVVVVWVSVQGKGKGWCWGEGWRVLLHVVVGCKVYLWQSLVPRVDGTEGSVKEILFQHNAALPAAYFKKKKKKKKVRTTCLELTELSSISSSFTTAGRSHQPQSVTRKKHHNYACPFLLWFYQSLKRQCIYALFQVISNTLAEFFFFCIQ